jgi:hypothetical protein
MRSVRASVRMGQSRESKTAKQAGRKSVDSEDVARADSPLRFPEMNIQQRGPPGPLGTTMSFCSSASGRACLLDWGGPLAVDGFLTLLLDLKRVRRQAADLDHLRSQASSPAGELPTQLPSGHTSGNSRLRPRAGCRRGRRCCRAPCAHVSFQNSRPGIAPRHPTLVFDSLSAAFAHAQRAAPHDVLELQRLVLRQSLPPNGHWT